MSQWTVTQTPEKCQQCNGSGIVRRGSGWVYVDDMCSACSGTGVKPQRFDIVTWNSSTRDDDE